MTKPRRAGANPVAGKSKDTAAAERPLGGGSYERDPRTGKLTRRESTEPAPRGASGPAQPPEISIHADPEQFGTTSLVERPEAQSSADASDAPQAEQQEA